MGYTAFLMENSNTNVRIGIIAVIIIAALGLGYWYYTQSQNPFPMAAGDSIESWDFQGSHNDDGPNEQRAKDEIARLEGGLKDEATEPPDYALYVSIANQYSLLGDGKLAYEYLGKALEIDSEKTGLAWHNMGSLMERLGALNTARSAYERAVRAQPNIEIYHLANLEFLMKHFREDTGAIEEAFAAAEKQFKNPAPTFQLKASWLIEQNRPVDAIQYLEQIRDVVPTDMQASIDAEIRDLQEKQ